MLLLSLFFFFFSCYKNLNMCVFVMRLGIGKVFHFDIPFAKMKAELHRNAKKQQQQQRLILIYTYMDTVVYIYSYIGILDFHLVLLL